MNTNVGGVDRIMRLVAGVIVFLVAVLAVKSMAWTIILAVLGVIIFLTGLTRCCPAYLPFGINTGKVKEKQE